MTRDEQISGSYAEFDCTVVLLVAINGFGDLGACPDEDVGIPDGCHTEFRVGGYLDLDVSDLVFNRGEPWLFRQGEEWPLHCVLLIPDRDVGERGNEQVGLGVSFGRLALRHGSGRYHGSG
jgi:hypothetical protein